MKDNIPIADDKCDKKFRKGSLDFKKLLVKSALYILLLVYISTEKPFGITSRLLLIFF